MKKYFIWISLVTGFLFLMGVGLSILQLHKQEKILLDEQIIAGKKIWQREGCMECHAIFGNGGYNASDLTKIMKRRDEKWLKEYFSDPPHLPSGQHKHHPGLAAKEVEDLTVFFNWVKVIDTKGWPPKPNFRIERTPKQK